MTQKGAIVRAFIRRGRASTSPLFYVLDRNGERWRFTRKRDAKAFVDGGSKCDAHALWLCRACGGTNEGPLPLPSEESGR